MGFFWTSPLGMVMGAVLTVIAAALIFAGINVVLAFSGGPGPCTPGDGPITVTVANAVTFQEKWDGFDRILDGGSPSSVTLSESEVSSRADQYITQETDVDFKDIRVCLHDGYGEGTAKLEALLGLTTEVRVKGSLDLTGDTPSAQIDDIEIGNVPGFITGAVESLVEDAIDEALQDINLKHTYTPNLSEGQAQIDGQP